MNTSQVNMFSGGKYTWPASDCVWNILRDDQTSHFLSEHSVLIHLRDVLHMSWFQLPILQKYKSGTIFKCIPHSPNLHSTATDSLAQRSQQNYGLVNLSLLPCSAGCHDIEAAVIVASFIRHHLQQLFLSVTSNQCNINLTIYSRVKVHS